MTVAPARPALRACAPDAGRERRGGAGRGGAGRGGAGRVHTCGSCAKAKIRLCMSVRARWTELDSRRAHPGPDFDFDLASLTPRLG